MVNQLSHPGAVRNEIVAGSHGIVDKGTFGILSVLEIIGTSTMLTAFIENEYSTPETDQVFSDDYEEE